MLHLHDYMEYEALLNFYNELSALAEAGDEKKAQDLMREKFTQLPEDVQGEIIARLYFKAAEDEVTEAQAIAEIQEKGLVALDTLEILKKGLEGKGKVS